MATRLALLGAVIALGFAAGCIGVDDGSPALETAGEEQPAGTESFTVTLADFPEGADWVALDVRTLEETNASFTYRVNDTYTPTPELRRCRVVGASEGPLLGASMGQDGAVRVTARPLAEQPLVTVPAPVPRSFVKEGPELAMGDGGRTTIILGYNDAASWREADAQAEFTVETDEPVRWRIIETGSMTCHPRLPDYEGGRLVEAGGTTYGEGMTTAFDVEGEGFGFAFPYSNGRHDFELTGPNGTVWEEEKTTLTERGFIFGGTVLEGIPSGEYQATVHEIVGHSRAGAPLAILDLPVTLADRLQR